MKQNETELTICIDLRDLTDPIGFVNHTGKRQFSPWDVEPIFDWIDKRLGVYSTIKPNLILMWEHVPDWLAMQIGIYLADKVSSLEISTLRMGSYTMKGIR